MSSYSPMPEIAPISWKLFCVDQFVDALANGEPALVALPLDLVNASHLARERFAPGEVVEFRLPVHSYPPS